ncbi:MAG: hypothetical protein JSS12_09710 [Verrucomicrobia bacterium]|nr:hypothetical protein [Verrucomicrobiota bacterium]
MVHPYNGNQQPYIPELADVAAHVGEHEGEEAQAQSWLGSIAGAVASSVASTARQYLVRGIAYAGLPSPGYYQEKITLLRDELFNKTGAHIASETAKVMAMRQIHKFTYLLVHHEELTKADVEHGPLKNFLSFEDGKVVLNDTGRDFLGILQNHTELLQETFEVNILRALCNGIEYAKRIKPESLVQFAQDLMTEAVSQSEAVESNDQFMKTLQEHIIGALFPNGEADIELPRNIQGILSRNAFLLMQEKAIPQKMKKVFDKATSEVTKYKLLAQAVNKLKVMLSTPAETKKSAKAKKSEVVYSKQNEFNAALTKLVSEFIDQIDSSLLKTLKPIIIKKVAQEGPKIVEKILTLDMNVVINAALKETCKRLNSAGSWTKVGERDVFNFVEAPILVGKAKELKEQEDLRKNKLEVDETVKTIAEDLEGLISRLGGKQKTYSNKAKQSVHDLFNKIRTGAVRFAFKVFGVDSQITKISKKVLEIGKKIKPEQIIKPLNRTISKKK